MAELDAQRIYKTAGHIAQHAFAAAVNPTEANTDKDMVMQLSGANPLAALEARKQMVLNSNETQGEKQQQQSRAIQLVSDALDSLTIETGYERQGWGNSLAGARLFDPSHLSSAALEATRDLAHSPLGTLEEKAKYKEEHAKRAKELLLAADPKSIAQALSDLGEKKLIVQNRGNPQNHDPDAATQFVHAALKEMKLPDAAPYVQRFPVTDTQTNTPPIAPVGVQRNQQQTP